MKSTLTLLFSVIMALFLGCAQSTEPDVPIWVHMLVKEYQKAPVANPPQSIWRYQYHGQYVYYVPQQCCDIPSLLLDANGSLLCHPDGGIFGTGDGRCTDFFQTRSNEKLVWKDQRTI